ncbi:MAG: sigma-70 family RNA polymerase sigma factor [Acidimicrobiales bacterium]
MPGSGPSTASLQQSLARLVEARDVAVAAATVPTSTGSYRWLLASRVQPAVDTELWLRHVRYARRRDPEALDALVDYYRPHAQAQARRHYRHGEPIEDLTQVAMEALLLALQRFDPARRRPFLAFAKPTITGMIRRHFRDTGWSIRVPRRVHELAGPVREARELLTQDFGREPTSSEVADFVGIDESEILDVMSAEEVRMPSSLDVVDPTAKLQTEQVVGRPDTGFAIIENRTALRQSLELLPEDDRDLLRRYFLEESTQTEIAEQLGCSQMQVSRLLARAIRRLRRHIVGL